MGKAYLLTGDIGVGKTTALQVIIDAVGLRNCEGFYSKEVRSDDGRTGFRIVMLDGRQGILADIESDSKIRVGSPNEKGLGKYGVELEFLETTGIECLRKAAADDQVRFVVVDEIGPMQLFSEQFKEAVVEVVKSEKILIGTIVLRSYPWADDFKQRGDVETFMITRNNRNSLTKMLSWFLSGKAEGS